MQLLSSVMQTRRLDRPANHHRVACSDFVWSVSNISAVPADNAAITVVANHTANPSVPQETRLPLRYRPA